MRSRVLALALALGLAGPLPAQGVRDTLVVVDDAVRAELAAAWDAQPLGAPERIYCALFRTDTAPSRTLLVYTVIGVLPAIVESAAWDGVVSRCPPSIVRGTGFRLTTVHTHPPFTCREDADALRCRPGGPLAWVCEPSQTDIATFRRQRYVVALVQCDRHAFVPWRAPADPGPRPSLWRRIWPDGTTVKAGGAVFAGFGAGLIDPHRGAGPDRFTQRGAPLGLAPDKVQHALGGAAVGAVLGWRPGCLLSAAQEVGQGRPSGRDFITTCAFAVGADYLTRRVRK